MVIKKKIKKKLQKKNCSMTIEGRAFSDSGHHKGLKMGGGGGGGEEEGINCILLHIQLI